MDDYLQNLRAKAQRSVPASPVTRWSEAPVVASSSESNVSSEAEARSLLKKRSKALGWRHDLTLDAANNLGVILYAADKLDEALPLFRRVLDAWEANLGPLHAKTLNAVNNLSSLLLAQGQLAEAKTLARRALAGKEESLGPAHEDTLAAANNLGTVLQA